MISAKGKPSYVPATAEFQEGTAGDRILSDGNGPYQDGIDCVKSYVDGSGSYFLRTVSLSPSGGLCTSTLSRKIALDFSVPAAGHPLPTTCTVTVPNGTLNICGPNSVADVRFLATGLFTSEALTNGSTAHLVFSLQPTFQGAGDFELDLLQPLSVDGTSGLRNVEASSTVIAELYQLVVKTGRGGSTSKVSLGYYSMPFRVTVGEE
jgi:hypothetical protein